MSNQKKFIVSHAPFWHNGSGVPERNYHTIIALLPAVVFGLSQYGGLALGVLSLAISSAIIWELLLNKLTKRALTVGDGNAALLGLLFGMLLPASAPWWFVVIGTFITVVIGKQIFGGIGSNPFHPVALAMAILFVSWKQFLDLDGMLVTFKLDFPMVYPLGALKAFGPAAVSDFNFWNLYLGQQVGSIGSPCGLALTIGGLYLILRGFIRWEISLSFIAGVFITALLFHLSDPARFAGPGFHIATGYTMIGAFFLATEDSSSPVNFIPMLIYGASGGLMTMLIRNIGAYPDGTIFAVLIINLVNPLLDKIRPKALGKVA
jgi:electron transport complex protein RnfD